MVEKAYYEKYWQNELPKMKFFGEPPRWEAKWLKRYTEFVSKYTPKSSIILDYGCGEGHFVNSMNKLCKTYGTDISDIAIEKAKTLYPDNSFTTLEDPFIEKFDVITCFDVMEHIFDFDELFKEFHYYLKKDGKIIIATNENCFIKMLGIGLFEMNTFFHPYSPHIRFFTKKTLEDLFKSKGYKVIHYERVANYLGLISTGQLIVVEKDKEFLKNMNWEDRIKFGESLI